MNADRLDASAAQKSRCRSRTNYLIRKGIIVRQPCEGCGSQNAQAHHASYEDPINVSWLCSRCHSRLHSDESKSAKGASLDEPLILELSRLLRSVGETALVSRLKIHRATLARALAGFTVYGPTRSRIASMLCAEGADAPVTLDPLEGGSSNGAGSAPDAAGVADAGAERAGKGTTR